ncbi:MAG: transaldolase [Nitrospirota bacterium]|nr:transaldolase [Nitrospirota bacterium]
MSPENNRKDTLARPKPKGRIADLLALGQSIWLDSISRHLMDSGQLTELIESVGVRGITSNPTIFEKAINGSSDYDKDIALLASRGESSSEIIRTLMVEDVRRACDYFRPVYDQSNADDGYVSIEVNPLLAHKTEESIEEARTLHGLVNRPNLFIKIPGTPEGIPAIQALIAEGISVNITLLFSPEAYRQAAKAYISGIEEWIKKGKDPALVRSVASLFISRLDTLIDKQLETIVSSSKDPALVKIAGELHGKAGIANTQIVYENFRELFHQDPFSRLKKSGARLQRPLWASTGTKNPSYSDVMYLDNLIAPDTVNTVPMETLKAFLDHGTVSTTLERYKMDGRFPRPQAVLEGIRKTGISLEGAYAQLISEGVSSFNHSFESLVESTTKKAAARS